MSTEKGGTLSFEVLLLKTDKINDTIDITNLVADFIIVDELLIAECSN